MDDNNLEGLNKLIVLQLKVKHLNKVLRDQLLQRQTICKETKLISLNSPIILQINHNFLFYSLSSFNM